MEKWYLPITIIPAVGLLLISTSNLINGLSQEIAQMIKDKNPRLEDIIEMKITQLGRLNRAMVGFYISAACLVLASFFSGLLTNAMINHKVYMFAFMIISIGSSFISIVFLSIYSLMAVRIKKEQFKRSLETK